MDGEHAGIEHEVGAGFGDLIWVARRSTSSIGPKCR